MLKVEELQMKKRILNFRKFKQVVSIILFPFALNFGGKQDISQNQSYTAQSFDCSELPFYDEDIFHNLLSNKFQEQKKRKEKSICPALQNEQ